MLCKWIRAPFYQSFFTTALISNSLVFQFPLLYVHFIYYTYIHTDLSSLAMIMIMMMIVISKKHMYWDLNIFYEESWKGTDLRCWDVR